MMAGSQESQSQDCVRSHSTALFNGEVVFCSLEILNIVCMDNIEKIWNSQVVADSFPILKSVRVEACNKLVSIVPSCILGWLWSLESLEVLFCGSLEVVFEFQPLNHLDGHPVAFPLKMLVLEGLPGLKCVWDNKIHHQVQFRCLCSISVSRCKSLTTLFPASVAIFLFFLEELKIDECGIVELIEREECIIPKFMFQNLTSLKLKHLPELKSIYTGTHASHWPALITLEVDYCDKVEILASRLDIEMPLDKQPLFSLEKGALPNLQELKLDLSKWMEIWHGNFDNEESFYKLRVLELRHVSKESASSTCHFIQSLTNLEELVVCQSYLEEPSSNMEAMEGLSHEQKVILPFSRHIYLKTLDVSHCDGLSNMFTSTIAGNLVALTNLRVSNCRMLTEVISDEGDMEGYVVAFNQLKYMELDRLMGLRCFSSAGYTLMFPLLEHVIVTKCPNMKFFSKGLIEAPKLEKVHVSIKEWFWKENSITIQDMFD